MLATVFDLIGAAFAAECGHVQAADSMLARFERDLAAFDRSTRATYHGTKGFVALRAGDPNAAIYHLEFADSLAPDGFSNRYYLANAYLDAGRPEDAITMLETILNRYSSSRLDDPLRAARAVYLLGTAYEKTGNTAKAIENYQIFLDMWKNADAELDEVPEAKERLDGLGAGS